MMRKDSIYQSRFALLCIVFSFLVLLASFSAEHLWKIETCRICKLQRLPYFFILLISGAAFSPRFRSISMKMIKVGFVISILLAGFHLLIIGGIISDPCAVPKNIATIDDFQRMLAAPLPCSKASWSLLGIPMAAYNIGFSLLFLLLLLKKPKSARQIQNFRF